MCVVVVVAVVVVSSKNGSICVFFLFLRHSFCGGASASSVVSTKNPQTPLIVFCNCNP
jgi:hypothetical protein